MRAGELAPSIDTNICWFSWHGSLWLLSYRYRYTLFVVAVVFVGWFCCDWAYVAVVIVAVGCSPLVSSIINHHQLITLNHNQSRSTIITHHQPLFTSLFINHHPSSAISPYGPPINHHQWAVLVVASQPGRGWIALQLDSEGGPDETVVNWLWFYRGFIGVLSINKG